MYQKFLYFTILFFTIVLPYHAHAAGRERFDGEYIGTLNSELTGISNESAVSAKIYQSQFTIEDDWQSGQYESIGLIGKIHSTANGQIEPYGSISGSVHTKVIFSFKGFDFTIYEYDSPLNGKISEGKMNWTASYSGPVKCIFGGNCNVDNKFSANLDKTATSDMSFSDQPEKDDTSLRIDQSLPIIEKIIGESTYSDRSKSPGFWETTWNHWQNMEGNVDIHGHRIDYNRVWEEGKTGDTLKVGDEIKTGNGRVILKFADGTRFILMENTHLCKTPDGFLIEKGVMASNFWKTGNKMRLSSQHGNFVVKGTKFAIFIDDRATTIEVYEGTVAATDNQETIDVTANHSLTINNQNMSPLTSINSSAQLQSWQEVSDNIEATSIQPQSSIWIWILIIVLFIFILFVIGLIVTISFIRRPKPN